MAIFASCVRLVCLVGADPVDVWLNVYLFEAKTRRHALSVALDLGRSDEEEYENGDGERVQWRLSSIESIDCLGDTLKLPREVYSYGGALRSGDDDPSGFQPESNDPGAAGVEGIGASDP